MNIWSYAVIAMMAVAALGLAGEMYNNNLTTPYAQSEIPQALANMLGASCTVNVQTGVPSCPSTSLGNIPQSFLGTVLTFGSYLQGVLGAFASLLSAAGLGLQLQVALFATATVLFSIFMIPVVMAAARFLYTLLTGRYNSEQS